MDKKQLHYNTVNPLLKSILHDLMEAEEFASFRLVGGTSLSLQIGHRMSIDIDLFTDAEYNTVDFKAIDKFLKKKYEYVKLPNTDLIGFGCSYFVGNSPKHAIKLDVYYTDNFIEEPLQIDGVRLATIPEILAMKMEVIGNSGRKKDFWDVHAFIDQYSFDKVVAFYKKRYPYNLTKEELTNGIKSFSNADDDLDPVCLQGKVWQLVKLDLLEWVG